MNLADLNSAAFRQAVSSAARLTIDNGGEGGASDVRAVVLSATEVRLLGDEHADHFDMAGPKHVEVIPAPQPRAFGAAFWECRCWLDNGRQLRKWTPDVAYCGRCNTHRPPSLCGECAR